MSNCDCQENIEDEAYAMAAKNPVYNHHSHHDHQNIF